MNLIAFTGLKGSGKDTAASIFMEAGFVNLRFADGLKGMLLNLLVYRGADNLLAARMLDGDLKEVPSELLNGQTPRYAMQSLGTEWGRALMADTFWVDSTMAKAKTLQRVVISDVRFPNEFEAVKAAGGYVVRINRPGLEAQDHASESQILSLPVDMDITNGYKSADDFRRAIEYIFRPHLR